MKQPGEAAAMYELGGQDDKAAAIYVAAKDLDKAATVMPRVTLPKLLGQYAKACEITGRCVYVFVCLCVCYLGRCLLRRRAGAGVRRGEEYATVILHSKMTPVVRNWTPNGAIDVVFYTRWQEAIEAHERARDMDSVVRLCLDQLDQPHRAFAIVRENASRRVVIYFTS